MLLTASEESYWNRYPAGDNFLFPHRDPERALNLAPFPPVMVREQSSPSRDLVGNMPIYVSRARSADLILGCGS